VGEQKDNYERLLTELRRRVEEAEAAADRHSTHSRAEEAATAAAALGRRRPSSLPPSATALKFKFDQLAENRSSTTGETRITVQNTLGQRLQSVSFPAVHEEQNKECCAIP